MTNTYKPIKRAIYDWKNHSISNNKYEFICQGEWADGHLAYSKIEDIDSNNYDELGMYYQVILNHQMVMVRC